jgi:thiol:disulfide interchange protein
MGTARLAVYLVGLILVVAAVWVFLTQTAPGRQVPPGLALAIILLLVGIGVMASARSVNDQRSVRRVVHEGGPYYAGPPATPYVEREVVRDGAYVPPVDRETVVEERRYD